MTISELIMKAPDDIKKQFDFYTYKKGTTIINPYSEQIYLYILLEGQARVFKQNVQGTESTVYLYDSNSIFGELELFSEEKEPMNVVTITDCKVIRIHKTTLYEWMKNDFELTKYIINQLSNKLVYGAETVLKLSLLSLKGRIIASIYNHYLLNDLKSLTKDRLCSEAFAPIRSVNRVINQSTDYYIFENKMFKIVDLKKIESYLEENLH